MFPFMLNDKVRHHLYGIGTIVSIGHRQASVRFRNGIICDITTDNLVLEPF